MPRKEDVFPSLRPRSVPPLTCTTGGLRFGPGDMAAAAVGVECSCADASLPTPAIAPPINAVVVPNICRRLIRFVRASRTWSAMLPPVSRRLFNNSGIHWSLFNANWSTAHAGALRRTPRAQPPSGDGHTDESIDHCGPRPKPSWAPPKRGGEFRRSAAAAALVDDDELSAALEAVPLTWAPKPSPRS